MSRLDFTQAEQLKEIGAYLGQVRLQQAISLEEVATRTFIPLRLLKALEAGQADPLPEPVFIQGFIRRYADLLGLDGAALSKAFPANPLPVIVEPDSPEGMTVTERERPAVDIPFFKIFLMVLAAAVLGVAVYFISSLRSQPRVADREPSNSSEKVDAGNAQDSPPLVQSSEKPTSVINAEPRPSVSPSVLKTASTPSPTPVSTPTDAPIQVAMEITSPSWVEVTVDGKSEFVGKLEKGAQKTWTAKQKVVVFTGNAGGVKVAFNQGAPEVMGKSGTLAEKTFSLEKPEAEKPEAGNGN